MRKAPIATACAAVVLLAATAQAKVPEVLASIAPIHSLAAAVMQGVGEPQLLVPSTASDHDYALRPSDLRKIAAADLVLWVGEPLEAYLAKPLETEGIADLELIELPGMDPHQYASAGEESSQQHADHEDHHEGSESEREPHGRHAHDGVDPHIWLDPQRARLIVEALAERLAALDPDNADRYRHNAAAAVEELTALDAEIAARLAPVASKPFVTFHDGYSYFVERYGLSQVGHLAADPEQRPGAAGLADLRDKIIAEGVVCVFAEPQFDPGVVTSLAGAAQIKVGILDAIGAQLDAGPHLYATLLRANAEAVESCLLSMS